VPLSKWVLHELWSSASAFNFQYPFFTLKSRSSYLRLCHPLPVTSILPYIFPSITCFRRQFLCKMWPIQVAFLICIVCRSFLSSLTVCNISSFLTQSLQLIFSILLHHYVSKLPRCFWSTFWSVQFSASYKAMEDHNGIWRKCILKNKQCRIL